LKKWWEKFNPWKFQKQSPLFQAGFFVGGRGGFQPKAAG
jgi:hypothetical protein